MNSRLPEMVSYSASEGFTMSASNETKWKAAIGTILTAVITGVILQFTGHLFEKDITTTVGQSSSGGENVTKTNISDQINTPLKVAKADDPPAAAIGDKPTGAGPAADTQSGPASIGKPDITRVAIGSDILAAAAMKQAGMEPSQKGIDLHDYDLDKNGSKAESVDQCAAQCQANSSCKAITYVISARMCWLKDRREIPALSNPDMISALKAEPAP
jgi:hypothetical protein